MDYKKVLITGSCGLVGSEATYFYTSNGAQVTGVDNDRRGDWFGKEGSTTPVLMKLERIKNYKHHSVSIINKMVLTQIVRLVRPDLIIHCAAQPSHDQSAKIPFEDFMVNATGTVNLLEAAREHCPETPLIYVSTNKVYGDRPNLIRLAETDKRYNYHDENFMEGVDENMCIDQSMHSPFGCSKASADLMVQEYGRYYNMPTVCFRCGCITGEGHQGVELHGFLSYLCKAAKMNQTYTIYGYNGKQVRDNIHVSDLVRAFDAWAQNPRKAEVYNMGGGRNNSCSIIEAIDMIKQITGLEMKTDIGPARKGDHICYYTNFNKFIKHYPNWSVTRNLTSIMESLLL
jgi:CDP-paratose 2-epimerase